MMGDFDDGTKIEQLFNLKGVPVLPGLISFKSSAESAATVSKHAGTDTLRGNSAEEVFIEADAEEAKPGFASATTKVAVSCNLNPEVGDIDLGSAAGTPISAWNLAAPLSLPLRVNTGSTNLGAFYLA